MSHDHFVNGHPFLGFGSFPQPPTHQGRNNGQRNGFGGRRFLKKLAFGILFLFCVSMLLRLAALVLALMFSPPVLLLCLFALLTQNAGFPSFNPRPHMNRFRNRCFVPCGGPPRRRIRRDADLAAALERAEGLANNNKEANNPDEAPGRKNQSEVSPSQEGVPSQNEASEKKVHQNVQVYREETGNVLSIILDLPGYKEDEVKMTMDKTDLLNVRGERKNRIGITFFFEQKFELNEDIYDLDSIDANMEDGVLEIKVPHKPKPQPRVIPISTKED